MKKALICGISGQDGSYLAKFLLDKGYKVYGTSRDIQMSPFLGLERLGIRHCVNLESMAVNDFRSVLQVITKTRPDELYNLAGQSSVALSFQQPVETLESIAVGTLNLLEAIRFSDLPIKFYNAGSSECFGDTGAAAANENTPFRPRSPYAVAKATSIWEVANYREAYRIFACSGILFNHDSPLRPERFVTRKIISAAHRISKGSREKLRLGNLSIRRDWGWAPEYIKAMWMMLQQKKPGDFVIATGESHRLEEFVENAFTHFNLHWKNHVTIEKSFFRPTDILNSCADPAKSKKVLGWKAISKMSAVVKMMAEAESKISTTQVVPQ